MHLDRQRGSSPQQWIRFVWPAHLVPADINPPATMAPQLDEPGDNKVCHSALKKMVIGCDWTFPRHQHPRRRIWSGWMHGHSEVPVSRICHIEFMAVRRKSRNIQGIEGAGVCLGLRLISRPPRLSRPSGPWWIPETISTRMDRQFLR